VAAAATEKAAREQAERAKEREAEQRGLARANEAKALAAAAAEKAAKEQTEHRLAQIEKGVDLFAGLLRGINPQSEELGGPTVYEQLRERAEKAADQLDAESVGDPLAVARLQTIYGNTLRNLGNAAKAVELLEKARRTHERELEADHPDTLNTLHNLAAAYQDAGRTPEAIALYDQVRDAVVKKLGADHPNTLATLNNLAGAYQAAGRRPEAIALYEQLRDAVVKKLGADHPNTLDTLHNLATAYRDAGRMPEAEKLLREYLTIREKTQAYAWPTFYTQSLLGEALMGQKKYTEVEPLLLKGYEGLKAHAKVIPPQARTRIPEAIERLVQLYEATGRKDDADSWRKELDAVKATQKTVEKSP
jgi:tetratricopeptide (TPR) repeat protein